MTSPQTISRHGFSSRSLAKAIFEAPSPEEFARTLPAQALYFCIRHVGLTSSSDLVMLASIEQTRLMLDLDLWKRDALDEDALWEWLSLGDDEEGLQLLQKLIHSIDLKLIALVIARHVQVQTFEEPTDSPPGAGFYTPDKGSTWLFITLEDGTKHFLLGRLLAMLFETNANLFYKLLAVPGVSTTSMLEEESYSERNKRLAAEGIPEPDLAAEIHSPIPSHEIKAMLAASPEALTINDIDVIEPLLYDAITPEPLAGLLRNPRYRDDLQAEITYVLNSALVHFGIELSNHLAVVQLSERVKGAINLGLESAAALSSKPVTDVYEHLGTRVLYRHAQSLLMSLRAKAGSLKRTGGSFPGTPEDEAVYASLHARFPHFPHFLRGQLRRSHPCQSTSEQSALERSAREQPPPSEQALDLTPEPIASLALYQGILAWIDSARARSQGTPDAPPHRS